MVNVSRPDSNTGPSSSNQPDTTVGLVHNSTQFTYASPSGTTNNVVSNIPKAVANVRLAVTLAAGNATWTGLSSGADGQHLILWNTDATNTLTLAVQNTGSLVGNQFQGSSGSYALTPGNAILMVYYAGTVNAWVIIP